MVMHLQSKMSGASSTLKMLASRVAVMNHPHWEMLLANLKAETYRDGCTHSRIL